MTVPADGPTLVVLAAGRARRYGGCKPLAPIGPMGEPVIDLLASDAMAAGFGRLVLVLGPSTGPAIRYHVDRRWPPAVDIRFAWQAEPRGTVDAVLAALDRVGPGPFGVANADDLYGPDALSLLADHLAGGSGGSGGSGRTEHGALVSFRLRDAIVGDAPVTRGICRVAEGFLTGLDERRKVTRVGPDHFVAGDGRMPAELDGGLPVSMNLWGLAPAIRPALVAAMHEAERAGGAVDTDADRTGTDGREVLLPELVDRLLARAEPGIAFRVLAASGRCVGVTHPDDLPLVQAEVAAMVGRGERPGGLWGFPA